MSNPLDKILIGEDVFKEKMDALIIATAMGGAGSSNVGKITSAAQLQTLIRNGLGAKVLPVESQLTIERETAIQVSKGDSTGITGVTIDEDVFLEAVGEAHEGIYEATFDGSVWHKEDGTNIILADYGIGITGTPAEGDHIVVTESAAKLVFDVLDHDKHTLQNTSLTHSMVIQMRKLFNYGVLPFSPSQLMYYSANGLAIGKYKFTLYKATYGAGNEYNGTYVFEITSAIPAGGGWKHSKVGVWQSAYAKTDVTTGTITTYGAQPQRTQVQSGIAVREYDESLDSDATDLGTFAAEDKTYLTDSNNLTRRQGHGNNHWATSHERMWLNSTGKAVKSGDSTFSYWYRPVNNFDMPPSESVRKMAGFLHGISNDILELIQPVAVKTYLHPADRTGNDTYEITYDRVWLLSMTEMGLGNNDGVAEGSVFEYWQRHNAQADRIKYEGTTARYWWLRSPGPWNAFSVRNIYPSGELSSNYAYNSGGVVPACVLG